MNNEIIISNREPQQITINGGGQVLGIVSVLVNGVDVTEGSVAYVVVPTKLSELLNDVGFINHEVDPTVPYFVKQITQADINRWNNKQELLVSGTNIKTINGNNILGSGNLDISTSYTAGTGIEITEENVINNTITSYDDLTDLPTIPTATSDLLNDSGFLTENDVSDVALTGSYLDLSNTPTIPSATSELVNDSGFITKEVNDLENYLNYEYLYNYVLPKVSDSNTNISLNGTMPNLPLNITLSPSELSQDGTPTPSSPQDIHTISGSNTIVVSDGNGTSQEADIDLDTIQYCKIGNYEDKFIRNSGKNLANYNDSSTTGNINVGDIKANTDYTLYLNILGTTGFNLKYGSNGNTITTRWNQTGIKVYNFTTTESGILFINTFSPNNFNGFAEIMLVEGTYTSETMPEYEPYGSNEWYIKKNIGKKIYTGSADENWNRETQTGIPNNYYINVPDSLGGNTIPLFNNMGKWNTSLGTENYSSYISSGKNLNFRCDEITSVADFKTMLSNQNMIIMYPLATPTYTKITGTLAEQLENVYQKMLSYTEQTNISQVNNDLSFEMSVSALEEL